MDGPLPEHRAYQDEAPDTQLAEEDDAQSRSPIPDPIQTATPPGAPRQDPPRLELAETPSAPPGVVPQRPDSRPARERDLEAAEPSLEEGEPILLAAMLDAGPFDYRTPAGFDELVRIEGYLRSAVGAEAENSEPLVLTTLAPRHRGLTLEASPTLSWFVSRATNAPQEFVVLDKRTRRTVFELTLPASSGPMIQSVDLSSHGVELESDVDYRWAVAVVHDRTRRSRDTVAMAEIRRVAPSVESAAALDRASHDERGQTLAREGIWYDAFALLSREIARHPAEPKLRELRAAMSDSVGLDAAADFDRSAAVGITPKL
jgi:hypothetical protein